MIPSSAREQVFFSLSRLAGWLATREPNERYSIVSSCDVAMSFWPSILLYGVSICLCMHFPVAGALINLYSVDTHAARLLARR